MVSVLLCDYNSLKEKTYKKDIHALAPSLCDFFLEPAVWPWDRLISAMNEGRYGDLEIQSFEEVEKIFRRLVWVGVGHCSEMKCQV